jgi:hypothetical protein
MWNSMSMPPSRATTIRPSTRVTTRALRPDSRMLSSSAGNPPPSTGSVLGPKPSTFDTGNVRMRTAPGEDPRQGPPPLSPQLGPPPLRLLLTHRRAVLLTKGLHLERLPPAPLPQSPRNLTYQMFSGPMASSFQRKRNVGKRTIYA